MVRVSLIICAVFLLNYTDDCFSQVKDSVYNKNGTVYWFDIKPKIIIHKKTKKEKYIISLKNKKVNQGSLKMYEKHLSKSIFKGKYLPIGPFGNQKDAKFAIPHYDLKHQNDSSMIKELNNIDTTLLSNEFYWFVSKHTLKRKRTPKFQRVPARIASGNLKMFKEFLWESTFFRRITIGPFSSKIEAERAKRLYRLEDIDY